MFYKNYYFDKIYDRIILTDWNFNAMEILIAA